MQQNLTQQELDKLREEYIGKRISVEDGKGETWIGTLVFLGYNSFFSSWGLCATLDRLPIQHIKIETIKLKPLSTWQKS